MLKPVLMVSHLILQKSLAFCEGGKDRFIKKYLWLLMPVLFFIVFIPENTTGITNLYRILIVLPILCCVRVSDLYGLWKSSAARWFIFLCGWMLVSFFFDGYDYKDLKLFWRLLNILALFYLIFLYARYHVSKACIVGSALLFFGFLGVVLILVDWEGLRYLGVNKDYYLGSSRGVFDHHLEVGWVVSLLGLVSLNQFLNAIGRFKVALGGVLAVFFLAVLIVVQARGGYVFFAVGAALLLFLSPGFRSQWLLIGGTILLMLSMLLFRDQALSLWGNVLDRGSSGRYPIWSNGLSVLGESTGKLLLGHGLSANTENLVENFKAAHFHNFFINHTFYTGVVGLVLYFGLVLSTLKRAFSSRQTLVWGVVVVAMQAAFLTDGDRMIVNPSAMMLCFVFPLAMATFSPLGDGESLWSSFAASGRKHMAIFALTCLVTVVAAYGLSRDLSMHIKQTFDVRESMQAVVAGVPESGVITVVIEDWPPLFGHEMPVVVAGIERPVPLNYKCKKATSAWREGRRYLKLLFSAKPEVELRNIVREKQTRYFRLEADVFFGGVSLADTMVEKGFAVRPGDEQSWCSK